MQELRMVSFVARHTAELQGLRTALVGGLCLTMVAWCLALSIWDGTAVATQGVSWIPLILLGWHLDDRLEDYYRARMGYVVPFHPARRLMALVAITLTYVALRMFEVQIASPVAMSALFLAGLQLHIGLVSGEAYRRHYVFGAACWAVLSLVPLLALSPGARGVLWLTAMGLTLTLLGWRDHVLLMRSLADAEESADVKDV